MSFSPSVTEAVVPAAGPGTRSLPAAKGTPEEMPPPVDRPAVRYAVEEAAGAGLTDLVEKPAPGQFPGSYAVTGRHLLDAAVLGAPRRTPPGHGGRIRLAGTPREPARTGGTPVRGVLPTGRRYGTGARAGHPRTTVRPARGHGERGPGSRQRLPESVNTRRAAPAGGSGAAA